MQLQHNYHCHPHENSMTRTAADKGVWIYEVHIMQPSAVLDQLWEYFKVKIFKVPAQKKMEYCCGLFLEFATNCLKFTRKEQNIYVDYCLNLPEYVTKNWIFVWTNPWIQNVTKKMNIYVDYSLNSPENASSCVGNCGKEEMRRESILYQAVRPPVGWDEK